MVKKILIGTAIFLAVVIVSLATAPLIFREEIQSAVDEQLESSINADVVYNIDNFSLTFFANFPNLTAGISELGVVGREPFNGEVLFAVNELQVQLNIWKLLGSEISVQGIYLDKPEIFIKVLEDGTANYDIAISNDEPEPEPIEETNDFSFAVEHWRISNGHIIYNDATLPTYFELTNLEHSGSGNFSLSVFDLDTKSQAFIQRLSYDGVSYLAKRKVDLDLVLNMDLDRMKFTFRENRLAINDFVFGFEGWVAMPGDDIDLDLSFEATENTFKSLLSLVPAIYTADYDDLETSGTLGFNGAVKGKYNDKSMPAYNINLNVNDGMFHYPDLPETVNNVQVAMNIASPDGNVENTSIDISKFHIEFGKEPIDGFLKIGNLVSYPIDMQLTTSFDLANLSKLVPLDVLDIKGVIDANISAIGEYDSINATIPTIDARVSFRDGAISYPDMPAPLDAINMESSLINRSGVINDTQITISEFAMELDGNPITGELLVENFDNIHWRALLNGDLNFDKLFPIIDKLYPMPGMTLTGDIQARIMSEGRMSDLDNENYGALKTSGEAVFTDFTYADSVYLPQGIAISAGQLSFDPEAIKVNDIAARTGSSDFRFNGSMTNYLAYIFKDEEIRGRLNMESQLINASEFLTDSEEDGSVESPSEEYTIIEIPRNIDFTFKAKIDKINYDNLILEEARGDIIVRDGQLMLDDLFTKAMGGSITFNGTYDTKDVSKPSFAMNLDAQSIQIADAYAAFNTIRILAPIAKDVSGQASSNFRMNGILQEDMMPDMSTLNGEGKISVLDASLRNSVFASGIASFIRGKENQSLTLKDIEMNVNISNGRLQVEPFDLRINNAQANISGMSGLDGSVDYVMKMDIPAGQIGSQVNKLLGSVTGIENSSENISLNIGVTGSYDDPKFNLLGSDTKAVVTETATQKAADLVKESTGAEVPISKEEINAEAVAKARQEADKLLAEAQKQADLVKDEAHKSANVVREEAKAQAAKLVKEAGNNVFKKTAAEVAAKKLVEEAEKQATNIESEGEKQADAIMAQAREQANAMIEKAENK